MSVNDLCERVCSQIFIDRHEGLVGPKLITKTDLYTHHHHHKHLIGQKGDILMGSHSSSSSNSVRGSPSWPIISRVDILAGSLILTANEPARMSPSLYDLARVHLTVSIDFWHKYTPFLVRQYSVRQNAMLKKGGSHN